MVAGLALAAVSVVGMLQTGLGVAAVTRFGAAMRRGGAGPGEHANRPGVTILKPLHGDEPLLAAALESFFLQAYPKFQIVFGVHGPTDPAIAVVGHLRRRYPQHDVALVIDATRHGINHKISNVINMMGAARHDILVLADSDVHAAPDYLDHLVAALAVPGVGVATTLYGGRPARPGLPGAMGADQVSHVFLPGVLLGRGLRRQDCLGATMALRRTTLELVGGFAALADHLADDAMLGRLVRDCGFDVGLADTVPHTTIPEQTIGALVQHELRWARTIRSLEPLGHALSAVQFPIAWALAAVLASGGAAWALAIAGGAWAVRARAARAIDRQLGMAGHVPGWTLPLRDLLSVGVIVASYRGRKVRWRGQVVPVGRPLYALARGRTAPYRAAEPALGKG